MYDPWKQITGLLKSVSSLSKADPPEGKPAEIKSATPHKVEKKRVEHKKTVERKIQGVLAGKKGSSVVGVQRLLGQKGGPVGRRGSSPGAGKSGMEKEVFSSRKKDRPIIPRADIPKGGNKVGERALKKIANLPSTMLEKFPKHVIGAARRAMRSWAAAPPGTQGRKLFNEMLWDPNHPMHAKMKAEEGRSTLKTLKESPNLRSFVNALESVNRDLTAKQKRKKRIGEANIGRLRVPDPEHGMMGGGGRHIPSDATEEELEHMLKNPKLKLIRKRGDVDLPTDVVKEKAKYKPRKKRYHRSPSGVVYDSKTGKTWVGPGSKL